MTASIFRDALHPRPSAPTAFQPGANQSAAVRMPSQVSVLELKVGAAFKRPKGFELAGTWLGFGDEIEVLAPPALRERMAQQAGAVLALYG